MSNKGASEVRKALSLILVYTVTVPLSDRSASSKAAALTQLQLAPARCSQIAIKGQRGAAVLFVIIRRATGGNHRQAKACTTLQTKRSLLAAQKLRNNLTSGEKVKGRILRGSPSVRLPSRSGQFMWLKRSLSASDAPGAPLDARRAQTLTPSHSEHCWCTQSSVCPLPAQAARCVQCLARGQIPSRSKKAAKRNRARVAIV